MNAASGELEVSRQRSTAPGLATVSECMDWDLRVLDMLLDRVEWRSEQQLWHSAADQFSRFRERLSGRLAIEDELLRPLLEKLPGPSLESARVRQDAIHHFVGEIARKLGRGDPSGLLPAVSDLRELLETHHVMQRVELYRPADERVENLRVREPFVKELRGRFRG